MDNLTLISASFNTPLVTATMIKSFYFHHHYKNNVLICENSTNEDTENFLKENRINYIKNPGGTHAQSVDLLLEKIDTKYALLVDTDIIFLNNHELLFEMFKNNDVAMMGEVCGDRGGRKLYQRVHPWHCFIDVEKIRSKGIKFHNVEKSKQMMEADGERGVDVGCQFFLSIMEAGLKVGNYNGEGKFYHHYEGMSWRTLRYDKDKPIGPIDNDPSATHNVEAYYIGGQEINNLYFNINMEEWKYRNINVQERNKWKYKPNPTYETFIIIHDRNIIKLCEERNRFKNLGKYTYLLVGNNQKSEPDDKNIIVVKELPFNIEDKKWFLQFTAWMALQKNKMVKTDYINLFEYDVIIKDGFIQKLEKSLKSNLPCYGYLRLNKNCCFINPNDKFCDGIVKYLLACGIKDLNMFINNTMLFDEWIQTSNICIRSDMFDEYIESGMFSNGLRFMMGSNLAGHMLERLVSVYLMLGRIRYGYIDGVLEHLILDSHGTQPRHGTFENRLMEMMRR